MSIFGALAATVPVLGSMFDPDLAAQRKLEDEEKKYMQSAQKAEAAGDHAAAVQFRAQARMTHNQRIRLVRHSGIAAEAHQSESCDQLCLHVLTLTGVGCCSACGFSRLRTCRARRPLTVASTAGHRLQRATIAQHSSWNTRYGQTLIAQPAVTVEATRRPRQPHPYP